MRIIKSMGMQHWKLSRYLSMVDPIDLVVDLGAQIGEWSIALCEQLEKQQKKLPQIYAIEPVTIKSCAGNTSGENLEDGIKEYPNITIFPHALANTRRQVEFWDHHRTMVGSAMNMPEDPKRFTVEAYTWDYFVNKYQIKHIDLLKIDIEGAEREILDSITTAIPNFIEIEFHVRKDGDRVVGADEAKSEIDLLNREYDLVQDCYHHHSDPRSALHCYIYKRRSHA